MKKIDSTHIPLIFLKQVMDKNQSIDRYYESYSSIWIVSDWQEDVLYGIYLQFLSVL